ncbi:hypothetical protein CSA56_09400 [candidate division KSB3 bacterium]|uniref:DUF218 domain-containing protein n=1 Tax=candidate division KSB3 bacterium TaxID=2044937 RepID=A0A2G6KDY4_9BACT|nr:MAG: hypothetical protein CSA56_09400 [candidate division KSB3 bacterium]
MNLLFTHHEQVFLCQEKRMNILETTLDNLDEWGKLISEAGSSSRRTYGVYEMKRIRHDHKQVHKIGVVCSYGIIPDKRLRTYCASVAEYVSAHQLDVLILTGGHTVENASETEARVAWELIYPRATDCSFLFEEHSLSTLHNLLYARELLEKQMLTVETLYIFCDRVRFLKVLCLSKIIFKNSRVHVVQFKRQESVVMYLLQIPFTLLQCLGAVCPPVENLLLRGRRALRKYHEPF